METLANYAICLQCFCNVICKAQVETLKDTGTKFPAEIPTKFSSI